VERLQRLIVGGVAFCPDESVTVVMPVMSSDDFSVHREGCERFDDGMPLSDLPDEVTSIDDLDCECWSEFDSLSEIG